jgi:hydrogenase expression/formation protein HypC
MDQAPQPGDFVLVHVGYAIQTLTPSEAQSSLELFDEFLAFESPDTDLPTHA